MLEGRILRRSGVGIACFGRQLPVLVLLLATLCSPLCLKAQGGADLPAEPILRVASGQHVAMINSIDTDAANRFAVTASDDKTVRVWSLSDGKLLRVLRLPLDPGDVGKAYAVAISPDGDTVAAGGWTGPPGQNNIFLFDRASGELKQRLSGLPDVIHHLAFSPDGRRLAASLGSNGIRVYDAGAGYQPLPSDTQYNDRSSWAQFDRTGRLVTTSYDGLVRLYGADRYAAPITSFRTSGRPFAAAFSPDGSRLAVGEDGSPNVRILSGQDLKVLFAANTSGISGDNNAVGWSQDGRFLFAGGTWLVNNVVQVRRWGHGGRGKFVDIVAAPNTIIGILPLKSGRMLFANTFGFGLIGPDAKVIQLQGFGALALGSGGNHSLRVSADGRTVQVAPWGAPHTYRFALSGRQVEVDPSNDTTLRGPVTEAAALAITGWFNTTSVAVNGVPLKLESYETAESVAVVPGTQDFVLGTSWSLRLFDQQGHALWPEPVPVPGEAWHVNVPADARLIVAAFGDGTIRWFRVSDGKEILALFIHPDGQRWIAWTPQGYYDASAGADDLIGWHVNHGYDHVPDFYPISVFRDRFYRRDVIQRVLQTLDVAEAVRQADQAKGRPTAKAAPVSSLLTPVVTIEDPKDPTPQDRTVLQLTYSVRLPSPDDALRVEALVDGVKVKTDDRRLEADKGDTRIGLLRLAIPRRDSTVSVIASNNNGPSVPALVHVQWRGAGVEPKLTLYVLAIGISNYKDEHVSLHFAAKDADDFVSLAKAQQGGLYEKVIMHPPHGSLRDSEATREAILDELDWIMRAVTNTNDVAMIFLSGHGITTPDQHYRFLPYDYDSNRVERTTISDSELQDYLTKIGGKKVFFFDTCYSGDVLHGKGSDTRPNVDKFANELRAAENGVIVFASSTGNQLSLEKPEWNNGAFTKAVVEGLHGEAARPNLEVVSIADLEGYVSRRVKELTNGNQRPMTAKPKTVEDFWIAERVH